MMQTCWLYCSGELTLLINSSDFFLRPLSLSDTTELVTEFPGGGSSRGGAHGRFCCAPPALGPAAYPAPSLPARLKSARTAARSGAGAEAHAVTRRGLRYPRQGRGWRGVAGVTALRPLLPGISPAREFLWICLAVLQPAITVITKLAQMVPAAEMAGRALRLSGLQIWVFSCSVMKMLFYVWSAGTICSCAEENTGILRQKPFRFFCFPRLADLSSSVQCLFAQGCGCVLCQAPVGCCQSDVPLGWLCARQVLHCCTWKTSPIWLYFIFLSNFNAWIKHPLFKYR